LPFYSLLDVTLRGLVERYQHFEKPAASIFMVTLEAVGSPETLVPLCHTAQHSTTPQKMIILTLMVEKTSSVIAEEFLRETTDSPMHNCWVVMNMVRESQIYLPEIISF
jgi:hypothetical protein